MLHKLEMRIVKYFIHSNCYNLLTFTMSENASFFSYISFVGLYLRISLRTVLGGKINLYFNKYLLGLINKSSELYGYFSDLLS